MPKRIHRKRKKGWRMPANAVYVGRPTKWGNPFQVLPDVGTKGSLRFRQAMRIALGDFACNDRDQAVAKYREWLTAPEQSALRDAILRELRDKDLCCWCGNDACHADVLLELANQ